MPSQLRNPPEFESRWTPVDGLRAHARVSTGARPRDELPLVLVHGFVISSLYLMPLARHLAPDVRVLAPDLPGFGESDKPDRVPHIAGLAEWLAGWMGAVGVPRAVMLGNSMGCQVVAALAARHPERVAGVILTGPTIDPRRRNGPQQIGRWLVDATREKGSLAVIQMRDYWRAGPSWMLQTYRVMMRDRIEERLPEVRAPALVVRGARDPIVPQDWAEEATRLLPRGRLIVIPGAPHALNYSAPLELARVTRPFLHELSAPASSAKPNPG